MTSRMMTCARCGGIQWQSMVDASTYTETVLIPGRWDACMECGWTGAPMGPVERVPCMGPPALYPMPPSPLDILRAAGWPEIPDWNGDA